MQILINIDESTYHRILRGEYKRNEITDILLKSKILPEHEDLIDRKDLLNNVLCQTFGLRSVDIENAPTIIPANKEK